MNSQYESRCKRNNEALEKIHQNVGEIFGVQSEAEELLRLANERIEELEKNASIAPCYIEGHRYADLTIDEGKDGCCCGHYFKIHKVSKNPKIANECLSPLCSCSGFYAIDRYVCQACVRERRIAAAERERCAKQAQTVASDWKYHGDATISSPYSHLTVSGQCEVIERRIRLLHPSAQDGTLYEFRKEIEKQTVEKCLSHLNKLAYGGFSDTIWVIIANELRLLVNGGVGKSVLDNSTSRGDAI